MQEIKPGVHIRSFLTIVFSVIIFRAKAAEPCTVSADATNLVKLLGRNHFSPAANTPENNNKLVALIFSKLDPLKLMLNRADIQAFQKRNYHINDSLHNDACRFVTDCSIFLAQKNMAYKKESEARDIQPIIFSPKDTLFPLKLFFRDFANTEAERNIRLREYKNWRFLNLAYGDWDKKGDFAQFTKQNEKRIIMEEIRLKECDVFYRKQFGPEQVKTRIISSVMESITELYDPHSTYFSTPELNAFKSRLSAVTGSFGVTFDKNKVNRIEVGEIEMGSNASKSGEIEKGDLVTEIAIDGKKIEDIECKGLDDLNEQIENETGKTLTITVKKGEGSTKKVVLTKSLIEVSENHTEVYRLISKNQKTGYIPLPAFFRSGSSKQSGAAALIGQEIINLQLDGINGLIIDLRNNGGGSVKEALDLIGFFIDVGPVGINLQRNGKQEIIKESIRGTLYNGPLILLVNKQSASASEITAGALQDLGRAIVVGTQTFGKATVQQVLPLPGKSKEQNHVKTTIGIQYRISGISHQGKGITPDIVLENPDEAWLPVETDYPGHIVAPPITKRVVYPMKRVSYIDSLQKRSESRWVPKTGTLKPYVLLTPNRFLEQIRKSEADTNRSMENLHLFEIQRNEETKKRMKLDKMLEKNIIEQQKDIWSDREIGEAFRILNDYHTFEKNK